LLNLASYIDHTILRHGATAGDVDKVCVEASMAGFAAVCIPPRFVAGARKLLGNSRVKVATVVSFPYGFDDISEKEREIVDALAAGADELDMVINLSALKSSDWSYLEREIEACIKPIYQEGKVIKVIVESGILTDTELVACCELYSKFNIDFMKTSTGFASTGATIHAVEIMRANLPPRIGIKAAGGIRSYAFAKELIDAGATRLGCTSSLQVMKEFKVLSQ
jgi:deoxyribose-phosphate aldolase